MKKSLDAGDLVLMAVRGERPTKDQILAMYADRGNWKQVTANRRNYWAWVGPMTVGYEAAQIVLKESDHA